MANEIILYEDSTHKCIMLSFDDEEQEDRYLSVNQFLIIQNNSAILIDPGSQSVFQEVYDVVEEYVGIEQLKYIFFSHQDPDVAGSIAEWSVASSAKIVLSGLWTRFMGHYGLMDMDRITALPDKGAKISFGDNYLEFIPAHFLHSPGNFSLYDSRSKIVFSGDIGAAVMPPMQVYKTVTDFNEHLPYLETFHKRYMAGNLFTRQWASKIRDRDVEQIVPQHGAIFKGEHVDQFLTWFETLQCGGDLLSEIY